MQKKFYKGENAVKVEVINFLQKKKIDNLSSPNMGGIGLNIVSMLREKDIIVSLPLCNFKGFNSQCFV